ncbi:MAG: hypothetical protein LBI48_00210 [Burkholderiaceae bacterium]|jgi:hypothetical protein|nr:hypothetical protein [Burkholderiaceae bacterium]
MSAAEPTPPRARLWKWVFAIFAPPLAATAWYVWLKVKTDDTLPPVFALENVPVLANDSGLTLLWFFLWPVLAVLAGIALLFGLRRRLGWPRLGLPLLALWWLLCAALGWKAWGAYADRAQLEPAQAVWAQVLGVYDKEPSTRGPGGALVFMQSPAWPGPRRALLEGAPPGSVTPGGTLDLRIARGARGGEYVTAWSAAASAPASAAPPAGR